MLILALSADFSYAPWGRTANDYIRLPFWRDARICSDGNGGCWAVGMDGDVRPGIGTVGLVHFNRDGDTTWGLNVVQPLPNWGSWWPRPVQADNGDVILAMIVSKDLDAIEDSDAVFIQRINLNRERLWGENGIELDSAGMLSQNGVGVYKGPIDDTYLVYWDSDRNENRTGGPRLQLIDGEGEFLWGERGIGLGSGWTNSQIVMTSDHCVIVAQNVTPTPAIEIIKLNSAGEQLWDSRFDTLGDNMSRLGIIDVESDREGGVLLVNEYERRVTIDDTLRRYRGVNALRISRDGDSLWTRNLYERDSQLGKEFRTIKPIVNYAGSGRFFVAWADRHHQFCLSAINISGELIWLEPIDVIIPPPADYYQLDAVDSENGVCYVWKEADEREIGGNWQQWGQRISLNGSVCGGTAVEQFRLRILTFCSQLQMVTVVL